MDQTIPEMFLLDSVGESEDEEMALDASEEEDDLEANGGNGIWERRRNRVIKNRRLVKNNERVKAKQSKTMHHYRGRR